MHTPSTSLEVKRACWVREYRHYQTGRSLKAEATVDKVLEVIVKTSERCNIACSYCYFFYGGDNSYKLHPARLSRESVATLCSYLAEGATSLGLTKVCVDFHGGEPLLIGKKRFSELCYALRTAIEPHAKIELRCQTNGMLIDADWIDVFCENAVMVGVSIDGPPEYHNEHRRGFDRKSTYDEVVRGWSLLRSAVDATRLDGIGALCVIRPDRSARRIFRHFVDDLGITRMDFLLPDNNHQSHDPFPISRYSEFLRDLVIAWAEDGEPRIRVRILESVFALLLGGESKMMGFGRRNHHVITVSTAGTIGPDDTLRSCSEEFMATGFDVRTSTLADYLSSTRHTEIEAAAVTLPKGCSDCAWQGICGGGALVNRYGHPNAFDNPSVYCEALKSLYITAAGYLLRCGVTEDQLVESVLG